MTPKKKGTVSMKKTTTPDTQSHPRPQPSRS